MQSFQQVRARAEERKGGAKALKALLPPRSRNRTLAALGDDRVLAEMTRRVFSAGFVWRVIDAKWDGFEQAFLGFDPSTLLQQEQGYWDGLKGDARIVRNPQKIQAVRHNARFVLDVAREHGSFGALLAGWPADDQVGLMDLLARRGSRLGGLTGQMLLRFLGWDGFVLSQDVVACLRMAGLPLGEAVKSRRDLSAVQAQFNAWAKESRLSYVHLSRICAMSAGENYPAQEMLATAHDGD